ncbi:MAG: DNA double-strand break repair nuclease NurA [Thermomicrobiales bacterium]
MSAPERPFAELPAALVQEVLERTQEVGEALLISFQDLQSQRATRRQQLDTNGLLSHESDLEYVPIPTSCGVDGACAIERLLATDLIAAAAVAMEGLTPPSETRYWPDPRHQVFIDTEAHDADSGTIARGIMMGMELSLATQAPHDVVLFDGSLTTPIIFFNQALNQVVESPNLNVSIHLLANIKTYLSSYQTVLRSQRSDKCWVALPKYTTRREIGQRCHWPESLDDRAMLTSVLRPGEMTRPIGLNAPKQPWHLNISPVHSGDAQAVGVITKDIIQRLEDIRVLYYRPYPWLPALRLEMGRSVAETPGRLASVVHAVKHQCGSAAMMEPYPLYMADRMAKSLASAIPAFRQVTSQHMAEKYRGDVSDIFLGLHGYRTESVVPLNFCK